MAKISLRTETITENKRLTDNIYYSWFAQNIGSAPVSVYGISLLPGEGLNSQSIAQTSPEDIWNDPIEIVVQAGGAVRMLRASAITKAIGKATR